MALLSRFLARRGRLVTLATLGLFLGGGCAFLGILHDEDAFAFSHRVHVVDQGLGCTACPRRAETEDDPGMPSQRQCMLCHEELDAEKPDERKVAALFAEGKYARTSAHGSYPGDLQFSHLSHATREADCSACHAAVESNDRPARLGRASMDECMACHAQKSGPNECSSCHAEIDRDWQPANHFLGWRKLHGDAFRAAAANQAQRCDLCHTEQGCASCHAETPPENHSNYWRVRAHGLTARLSRSDCAVCHRSDTCERCHRSAEPLSHRGASFGGTLSTHCLTCHFPLNGESCAVCHQDTPSHFTATTLPDDHSPGMNCRQCHGLTAPLPHVDKGDQCVACHQ